MDTKTKKKSEYLLFVHNFFNLDVKLVNKHVYALENPY